MQRVGTVEAHDRRAMDSNELYWVESFLEHLHRLPDEMLATRGVDFRVRPARGDVVDLRGGQDLHPSASLDRDSVDVRAWRVARGWCRHRRTIRAVSAKHREKLLM